ncbi:MAG: hypothetical protein ABJL67_13805 [Sulfitobacter sp.]
MPKTIHLSHDYPYPATAVWQIATNLDLLKRVVKGKVTFRKLPSGAIYAGQVLNVDVSLFGIMPYQPYRMEILSLDEKTFSFVSDEQGAGVRSWRHSLRVIALGQHSQIVEKIEIDAGVLTWVFCHWARYLYKGRHIPRLSILREFGTANKGKEL